MSIVGRGKQTKKQACSDRFQLCFPESFVEKKRKGEREGGSFEILKSKGTK